MAFKFRFIAKAFFYAASVLYPFLVFYFLVIKKAPVRTLSFFIMAIALLAFIAGTSKKKMKEGRSRFFGLLSSSFA